MWKATYLGTGQGFRTRGAAPRRLHHSSYSFVMGRQRVAVSPGLRVGGRLSPKGGRRNPGSDLPVTILRLPGKWRCPMDSVIVEIRAAEGGEDARLLCVEQFNIYAKMGVRRCL